MLSNEKAILWKKRIAEQQASGLTITTWCQNHEVTYRKFLYWKKQLSDAGNQNDLNSEIFAELSVSARNSNNRQDERIHLSFHDAEIDIPESFHPNTLLGLMKVLQQL